MKYEPCSSCLVGFCHTPSQLTHVTRTGSITNYARLPYHVFRSPTRIRDYSSKLKCKVNIE